MHLKRFGQLIQRAKREGFFRPFDGTDVGAMEIAFCREFFL